MSLRKGSKIDRGYATVISDDGVNYRDIADTMTELGFPMNHSSARNHVIRIMKLFAKTLSEKWNIELSDKELIEVAKSPLFQRGIADVLQIIEMEKIDSQ